MHFQIYFQQFSLILNFFAESQMFSDLQHDLEICFTVRAVLLQYYCTTVVCCSTVPTMGIDSFLASPKTGTSPECQSIQKIRYLRGQLHNTYALNTGTRTPLDFRLDLDHQIKIPRSRKVAQPKAPKRKALGSLSICNRCGSSLIAATQGIEDLALHFVSAALFWAKRAEPAAQLVDKFTATTSTTTACLVAERSQQQSPATYLQPHGFHTAPPQNRRRSDRCALPAAGQHQVLLLLSNPSSRIARLTDTPTAPPCYCF